MGYWKDTYGKRNQEFIDGVIAGVTAFAVWDMGKQYVGVMKVPLREMIEKIQEELGGGKVDG